MRRAALAVIGLVFVWGGGAAAGPLPNDPQLVLDIREGSFRLFMGWKTPTLVTQDGKLKPLLRPKDRTGGEQTPMPVRPQTVPSRISTTPTGRARAGRSPSRSPRGSAKSGTPATPPNGTSSACEAGSESKTRQRS